MIDLEKVGKRIALLRRERRLTGEALAERLQVSPQAVSKWENARCLPETAILPALAEALDCSIDSLLCPRELFVLEAFYTDGQTHIPVTHFVDNMVRNNALCIYVNEPFLGVSISGDRLKLLTLKYQTAKGVFFSYALQNDVCILDKDSVCFAEGQTFQIIGAYYGNGKEFSSAMQKMKHYEYFHWNQIPVNQETFPSSTASDDTEYLTLVYLNAEGIHVISCPENEEIYYGSHRTRLFLADRGKCILKGVMRLSWGEGMECPWAGALYAAFRYMGESYTYHQIMGMSGACWRVCFTEVWDYSCTDALVAFDYATPLFRSLGYSFRMVDRVEKHERKRERLAVMEDIRSGKPVLAINLRVAPEWGIITGYTENGARFLCRTYFDKEVFDELEGCPAEMSSITESPFEKENCSMEKASSEKESSSETEDRSMEKASSKKEGSSEEVDHAMEDVRLSEEKRTVFEENEGYLFNDFWPFLLLHFGERGSSVSWKDALKCSLSTLITSFYASRTGGYYQGREAYEAWIRGLAKDSDFQPELGEENVQRRLSVNDSMLINLIDSRHAAASYLQESIDLLPECGRAALVRMAENCRRIADRLSDFRNRLEGAGACGIAYNTVGAYGAAASELRREQADLLREALALDEENCGLAKLILEQPEGIGSC